MAQKSTQWITIPEESIHTPASAGGPAPVKNKLFWGIGFVIVIIVTVAMIAPRQFGRVLQGNLFDAPGVEAPAITQSIPGIGVLGGDTGASSETAVNETSENNVTENATVVQPETAPVSIQIDPIAGVDTVESFVATEEPDANRQLLNQLKEQVGALKTESETPVLNPVAVQPMPEVVIPEAMSAVIPDAMHSSAPQAAGTTVNIGTQGQTTGVPYRVNPHRVSVHPQTVLQQNLAGVNVAAYQPAPVVNTPQQNIYAQNYRANLANAYATPDTGPREVMLVAFAMTFFALLGWKAFKLSRS